MHWWRVGKLHVDDNPINGGGGRHQSKMSLFSRRSRARKLQNLTENDDNSAVKSALVSTVAAQPSPQPLPLPEFQISIERDEKVDPTHQSCNVPLPSPEEAYGIVHRGGEGKRDGERESANQLNAYGIDGLNAPKRMLEGIHFRRNSDSSESLASKQIFLKHNGSEISSDIFKNKFPSSAPNSPLFYPTPPGAFQVWSAPEMPHLDKHNNKILLHHISSEKTTSNVDNSPEISPLHSKISQETNAQANVHPLPLPPGAVGPSQSIPSFTVVAKHEFHPISPLATIPELSVASMPSHPTAMSPISLVAAKQEPMVVKGKWQKGKLIGRGTFGSVYIASNRETGALCAMKEVEVLPNDPKSAECVRQLEQEIEVLSRLKHPNIVQYYGSEIVGDKFYIYLEYVHPGSINKFIYDHCGAITESVVRNFTRHILCGLAYLHSMKTIHRDIKGANLLVDAYGVVKLADFGMAKHLTRYAGNLSLKGSPYWMAPELLQSAMQVDSSSDLALAVDIWSLGCTIIEMFTGKPPWSEYEGAAALFKVLKDNPPIPKIMSADGKDFLNLCFRRNPADRPTARLLLEHPFVKLSIHEIGQRRHHKTFNFAEAPLHSPRSTLDPYSG